MNESGFSISQANIAIIGLGLMGGSLALSLKGHCQCLRALDHHLPTLEQAREEGIVDLASSDPSEILQDADLIILACPVPAILDWLNRLSDYVQQACIVIDLGSSKGTIMTAFENLPANFDPLGGHAICGKENLSLKNADPLMYQGAPFVFTPLPRTSKRAHSAAKQITELIGANPIFIDADTHDQLLALTSHLPYLLSSTLILSIPQDAIPFIGPGFRSTARLAGTPSSMMMGVITSNRENILTALHQLILKLSEIETDLLNKNNTHLLAILDSANEKYQSLLK